MQPKLDIHIYNAEGTLSASVRQFEDAAMFVAFLGDGSTVRCGRRIVWLEGQERQSASESYDFAASEMSMRAFVRTLLPKSPVSHVKA